jgi:hypothetical protein
MKKYKLEDLLKSPPEGTTHILTNGYGYLYILQYKDCYFVWLGIKHGGWSMRMEGKHPHFDKLIAV